MGAVYEGSAQTGKRFAIKVLNPGLAAIPTARARFLREAKLASRVRNAHVVDVIEVREDDGHCYLVMELLEGEDLASRLRRTGTLSAAETAEIVLPVCDAVSSAHRQGITHRDLKPSNIFLTTRDGQVHPVVLDFGIAVEEGRGDGDAASPQVRKPVFGTPAYLAPEQVADHRAAGPATDQYALGVILYECLTGQLPFRGETVEEVFAAITAGKPQPPSALRPEVPHALDAIVLRAISADPKERFVWVAALRRALVPFASRPPVNPLVPDRPTPSSPAIAAEAAAPSPFVRTLTPEVEALDRAWFEAGDAPHETAHPAPDAADPEWDEAPLHHGDEGDLAAPGWWTRVAGRGRIWMGAGAGVAFATLAVIIVMARGGSSAARRPPPNPQPPEQAIVQQVQPPAAKPPVETVAVAPAPQPEPAPAAVAPPPAPPAPAPPAVAPTEPAPPAPIAAAPPPAPKESPAPAPAPPEPVVADEKSAPAQAAIAAPAPKPADKPADKPRARSGARVRMHNGVPLLD